MLNKAIFTCEDVNIIGPRSSFSISAPVGFAVSAVSQMSSSRGRAPSAMLNCEHSVASRLCNRTTFLNSVRSASIATSKKATSAFEGCYGSSASVFVATNAVCCNKETTSSILKQRFYVDTDIQIDNKPWA